MHLLQKLTKTRVCRAGRGREGPGWDPEKTSRLPAGICPSTSFLLVPIFSNFPATSSPPAFSSTASFPPATAFSILPATLFSFPLLFASCFCLSSCMSLGTILAFSPAIFSHLLPLPTKAPQEYFVFLMMPADSDAFCPTGNTIRKKKIFRNTSMQGAPSDFLPEKTFLPRFIFFPCSYRLQLPSKKSSLVPACAEWKRFYRLPALLGNFFLF